MARGKGLKKPSKRSGNGNKSREASKKDVFFRPESPVCPNEEILRMDMSEEEKEAKVQFYLEQMRQMATDTVYKSVYQHHRQNKSKSASSKNAPEKKAPRSPAIDAANKKLEQQKLVLGDPQTGARTTLLYPPHPPLVPSEVNIFGYMTAIDCKVEIAKKAKQLKLAARKKELQLLEDKKLAAEIVGIHMKGGAAKDKVIPEACDEEGTSEDDLGIEFEKVAVSVAEAEDQAAKKLLASPEKVVELGAQSFLDRTLNDKKSQRISQLVEQLYDELIVKRRNVERGRGHKELNLRSRIRCQLELLMGREKLGQLRAAKEKGKTDLCGKSIREEIIRMRMSQTELALNLKRSVEMYKVLAEHVEKREHEYHQFLQACNYAEERPSVEKYSTRTKRWSPEDLRQFA